MASTTPVPAEINYHRKSRVLELRFDDGAHFELGAEYLRVCSPSAEVRGHGPGQETLVTGKQDVAIVRIDPVGNYAVRLVFDDGHDTGLYSWEELYRLGTEHDRIWQEYLRRLTVAGYRRTRE